MRPENETDASWRAREIAARESLRAARLEEAARHAALAARLQSRSNVHGALRLVFFALGVWLAVRAARGAGSVAWIGAGVSALAFVVVVLLHNRVREALVRERRRALLANESAARLAGGMGPGAGGALPESSLSELDAGIAVYRPEERVHPLSPWALLDLGVEGEHPSLRDLLDTTSTELGARRLRRLLRHPLLDAAAIRARQEAIAALRQDRSLRDDLSLAYAAGRGIHQKRLSAFLASPRLLPGGFLRWAVHAFGAATAPLIALAVIDSNFVPGAALCAAASLGFQLALRQRAALLRDAYLELEPLVRIALEVAPPLHDAPPGGPLMAGWREIFAEFTAPGAATRLPAVARLLRLLHLHETGTLYGLIQLLTLWDLHWLFALESRVQRGQGHFVRLGGALADLEAHVAFAVFAAEQSGTCIPEILDAEPARLEIEAGEHPLLAFGTAVPNDVRLGGEARVAIVTGSNMAGKSTFLRMVAANTVLAQVGVPPRARRMRLVPLELHANIHVRDSLADGKSTFLVEVERVRAILAAAGSSGRLLGIFDELFRGTNSRERLAASREIARYLARTGGLFLIATHDQELARLAIDERVEGIVALHFRDEVAADGMVFPYTVQPGVAATTNAIRLLEMSGYPQEIVRRARAAAGETRETGRD